MPELPEVETIRRGLTDLIVGRRILNMDCAWRKSFQATDAEISQLVVGAQVISLDRRAKMLIIHLSGGNSLLIHLRMTGQLVWRGDDDARWAAGHPNDSMVGDLPDRTTRVTFTLTGGKLYFNDQRKFGRIRLTPTVAIDADPWVQSLGPEPLDATGYVDFVQRIRHHGGMSIKAALLDQQIVAGLGNIYADETLWLAQVHPETRVRSLTDSELQNIWSAAGQALNLGLKSGGSTLKNYVQADGTKGNYLDKFANAYGRVGQPCHRCGTEMIKLKVAGRGTYICPNCQRLV